MAGEELGYYTLPVILSFEGVDKQVNSSLGKAFGSQGTAIGKKFGKDLADGVKSSEADIKRAFENHAKLADRAADATGKLRAEQAKLDDLASKGISGGRLVQQAEKVEKARRDEARATRTAADALKDYENAAKGASNAGDSVGGGFLDKLKGLGSKTASAGGEAATGFVEGFGGPVAELGTKGGPIGLALAAAAVVALGAGALIAKQVMSGMDQLQDQANIQAKLGLSPDQMQPIAEAAGKAYAGNFGESVQANMEAAQAAIQSGLLDPNASEADTQKMIEQLQTVSMVMGEEIPATAKAAEQAIRNGLVKNSTEAFDLLVKAQQSGVNVNEDFLDTLNEYSTQFRKLSLDGPEAVGLISQAMKGGARDADTAADAIKEFSIRAIDGSKTTIDAYQQLGLNADQMAQKFAAGGPAAKEAFDQVLDSIRGISDPVKRNAVAVELFGTKAEDLGDALMHMDLSNAVEQLNGVEGATQKASDTMGNTAAGSFESAKRSIEVAASGMQQSLAKAFGPEVEKVAAWITAHQDDIVGFFKLATEAAVEFGAGVAITAGGVIKSGAQIVMAIGDLVGFTLDGFEQMTKGAASVARAVGADGVAKQLDDASKQLGVWSDEFHGWGEGLNSFGDSVINNGVKLHDLNDNIGQTEQNAANAAAQITNVKNAIGQLPDGKNIDVNAIVIIKDASGKVIPPDQLITPTFTAAIPGESRRPVGGRASGGRVDTNGMIHGPGTGTSDSILARVYGGSQDWIKVSAGEGIASERAVKNGWPLIDALNKGWVPSADYIRNMIPGFAQGGLAPGADFLRSQIMGLWPQITNIGGYRAEDGYGEHSSGNAIDVMIPQWQTPEGKALGDAVASFVSQNADALGLDGFIWRQTSYGYGHGFNNGTPMPDRGSPTQNHMDHVHVILGKGRGAGAPKVDVPTQSLTLPSGASFSPSGGGANGGGGVGTPGIGPNGEAGTYSAPDAKALREAQQKVDDADVRVKEAEAKQRELEADAKESQKLSAQADVDKAKREAADARADLDEVKKGKFTPGSSSKSSGGKGGGAGQFGPLGEIFGSFFKETFGIDGSFLPDISNLAPVKMIGTLLDAFKGPLQGAVDGQLGIQQPGWQPGMPVNGVENDTGIGGTSSAPFGMPDVPLPPMPEGNQHPGTGAAPGPVQNVTIDQSINGSQFGWGHDDIAKQRRNDMNRAIPRIPAQG